MVLTRVILLTGMICLIFRPYSPDLNPIEECFSIGKALLARNQDLCRNYPQRCFELVLESVSTLSTLLLFSPICFVHTGTKILLKEFSMLLIMHQSISFIGSHKTLLHFDFLGIVHLTWTRFSYIAVLCSYECIQTT